MNMTVSAIVPKEGVVLNHITCTTGEGCFVLWAEHQEWVTRKTIFGVRYEAVLKGVYLEDEKGREEFSLNGQMKLLRDMKHFECCFVHANGEAEIPEPASHITLSFLEWGSDGTPVYYKVSKRRIDAARWEVAS